MVAVRRIVLTLMALLFAAAAAAEQRIALVIGNSAYPAIPLANPANDARLMSKSLRAQGFDVIELLDADQRAFQRTVKDFGNRLKSAQGEALGLFYYAGHGLQVRGENFLIPVDAEIEDEGDVDIYAISANAILRTIEDARNRLNIVILDACRNNPFARSFRTVARGLALMEAPTGTLIAYSTAPGQVALDGNGSNSPYTEALAKAIAAPGITIERVFKNARNDVLATTQGQQTPWEASSLTGDDYYLVAAPDAAAEPAPAAIPYRADLDLAFFDAIKDSTNPADFAAYLEQFPDGTFATLARNRLAALSDTEAAAIPPPPDLIRQAQESLARLGYEPGTADGVSGRRTEAAVRAYQQASGLLVDGLINEALVQRLQAERVPVAVVAPPAPEPPRAYIGVRLQEVTADIAEALGLDGPGGALVADVVSGSSASDAGIMAGDILISFDGKTVETPRDMVGFVAERTVGDRTTVRILRDGTQQHFAISIGAAQSE